MADDSVAARFVSEKDILESNAVREEQWKAAYARLGQEPPPKRDEASYDGRSLFEKLAANKAAKEEEWQEKTKLSNQFRSLQEDEVRFLDSIIDDRNEEDEKRKVEEDEEVKGFKAAVAARERTTAQPPTLPLNEATKPLPPLRQKVPAPSLGVKKDQRSLLKGAIVARKKRPESASTSSSAVVTEVAEDGKAVKKRKASTQEVVGTK